MHIIVGILIIVASFLLAGRYMGDEFSGFFNVYSAILLTGVPVGLTILIHRWHTLRGVFSGLRRVLGADPEAERARLTTELVRFGADVRAQKARLADERLNGQVDRLFRQLGRHVLEGGKAEEIEADALVLGRQELDAYARAERVFTTLGNAAPAMGMIGTVLGLIKLLADMHDFDKLGAGMAIALLTTLYGLVLGHVVYLPIAKLFANYGAARASTINLILDGMLKLSRRRPIHEVREVLLEGVPAEPSQNVSPLGEGVV